MESRMDPHPNAAPLASGILLGAQKIQASDSSWKAPGAGRHSSVDYEAQQLLATKAFREKPNGPRFPTDDWSGMGFSRSMPSTVAAKMGDRKESKLVQVSDLEVVDEESDQIGPWPLEPATKQRKMSPYSPLTPTPLSSFSSLGEPRYFGCQWGAGDGFKDGTVPSANQAGASCSVRSSPIKQDGPGMESRIDPHPNAAPLASGILRGARRKLLVAIRKLKKMRRPSHRQCSMFKVQSSFFERILFV